jgi:hypothetical protein
MWFLNHISKHLKTRFNHSKKKNHHHFNQKVCEYLVKNKIYQINYFISVVVIQNNVLRMILGCDIPFVYPNHERT